jgi:hypothetical protein
MRADNVTNLGHRDFLQGPAKIEPAAATDLEVQNFDQTYNARLAQLNTPASTPAETPTAAQQSSSVEANQSATSVDAKERTRRALELEPSTRSDPAGDKILDGLQNIRGIIDAKRTALTQLSARTDMDFERMLAMQLEVAEYSLVVDATSKLIGKTTQTFDTLLKSQ